MPGASGAAPFFFVLPDNHTLALAHTEPAWGTRLPISHGIFEQTEWQQLRHVLVHSLWRHHARSPSLTGASVCVVASSPPRRGRNGRPEDACPGRASWTQNCPGRPVVVLDCPDADILQCPKEAHCCDPLWGRCPWSGEDPLVRVTGNRPFSVDLRKPQIKRRRRICRHLTVPYLAHARAIWAAAAVDEAARPVQIAYAAAVFGHNDAENFGFNAFRRALRNACVRLGEPRCARQWVHMRGQNVELALQLYRRSTFCLMPPGDTLARGAIIDAVTCGCIPVFFHPLQPRLWPAHWDGGSASVLADLTKGYPLPRARDARLVLANATAALQRLLDMPSAAVRALQRAVGAAAARLIYRRRSADGRAAELAGDEDAVDVLVEQMRRLQQRLLPEERAAHREAVARREADLALDARRKSELILK